MSGSGGLAGAPANKRARTVEPEPMPEMQLPPSPASPDVGEPSLPGAGAPAACKSHELPPMFVGMQPCYKPSPPSHQTREQELAAAACAEPLDAVAAAAAAATGSGSDNDEYDEY